ncbi:AraC family transcriptional regulator [Chitinophaga sp. S165]|uniref:helix-turn-helix domain-containing protein n=1 Tax=Chitinophaga sp. S165 TaxID=2135462 RepID=UPI001E3534C9|nr:helix-turn-helix domain-containing protein [Chitinophaga sp. S165]
MEKKEKIIPIKTISALHRYYQCGSPKHPLVSVMDLQTIPHDQFEPGVFYKMSFYVIACKRFKGEITYGRSKYDFEEGSMMFTAPDQVVSSGPAVEMEEGWALFFHPDLLSGTELERKMSSYSFFRYEANEALHISEEENLILKDCIEKIKREYSLNIDKHTQGLIVSNIELLLNYCNRFYDRQFITRAKANNDIVSRFERLLADYFSQGSLIESGLPDVKYFSSRLHLSPNYLSDLLSKHTGKTTQEHIHLQLVEKAKSLLWETSKSISEIAYDLGFEHPSHFTKIFKTKTGKSPKEYRSLS